MFFSNAKSSCRIGGAGFRQCLCNLCGAELRGGDLYFAEPLMKIFISAREAEVIACGVGYLRIEGAFYCGIGCLFLLYGYYHGVKRPEMSVVLTVISLGMRVLLAYLLSARIGEVGIWAAIPIGWGPADLTGLFACGMGKRRKIPDCNWQLTDFQGGLVACNHPGW